MIISNPILSYMPLLAQEPTGQRDMLTGFIVPMLLIMVMFYFVLIRPQRRQQKALEEVRKNLRVGDKVVTIGGVHGIVSGQTDKTVSVKVADGLSIKFDRSAISTVQKSQGRDDDSSN